MNTPNSTWPGNGGMPWPGVPPYNPASYIAPAATWTESSNPMWPGNGAMTWPGVSAGSLPVSSSLTLYYGLNFVSASVTQSITASYTSFVSSSTQSGSFYYYNVLYPASLTLDATQSILLPVVSGSTVYTTLNAVSAVSNQYI